MQRWDQSWMRDASRICRSSGLIGDKMKHGGFNHFIRCGCVYVRATLLQYVLSVFVSP
jgi:hypothetical protein